MERRLCPLIVDFSKWSARERPALVLRTLSGEAIQTLGCAYGVSAELHYNETSSLTFSYPAHLDGQRVPGYEKLVGMRIVDAVGIGQFLLVNPSIQESASKEVKTVTAYSLEYEFTFKKLTLEQSTYNFWNPAVQDGTILGIILEKMPSWHVGHVDSSLIGKYRTFAVNNENLYNFIKGTLQDSYGCIFDFDTYQREISVRDVSASAVIQPVYLSLHNLAKEIEVKEDTENIFTCLDVSGADGVSIRNVNPTGTNKIYDLDYFMTEDNFSASLIAKWNSWKQGYSGYQAEYFNRTVENALLHVQQETEKAALTELENQLKALEVQQSVVVDAAAQGIAGDLLSYVAQIAAKEQEITRKKSELAGIESQMQDSQAALQAINRSVSWAAYGITAEEQKLLDRYIKEDALEDSSFVAPEVDSYSVPGDSYPGASTSVSIKDARITGATLSGGKVVYTAQGGTASVIVNGHIVLSGVNIRSAFDLQNGSGVASIYLEQGCATLSGPISVTTDARQDPNIGGSYIEGTTASIASSAADVYVTAKLTAYSKRAVEWDLYDYGREVLTRLASPTYTFSVSSGNFLAMEDFDAFRRELKLGDKLYLDLGETFGVLSPVLIGTSLDFETKDLSLEFGDSFSLRDSAFKLADLLDQSVSMGKSYDLGKYNAQAFANAGGTSGVRDLINAMRDLSLQGLYSTSGQAFTVDGTGLRLREWKDDAHTAYQDEQIWMTSNKILFTRDGWNSVDVAIGTFVDSKGNVIDGVNARLIAGNLLVGENLIIESVKQDNGVAVFKVDADGAKLYNSQFDLVNDYLVNGTQKYGQISLNPSVGLIAANTTAENSFYHYDSAGGINGIKTTDGSWAASIDALGSKTPAVNLWADNHGDLYIKGTVYATDGKFTGEVIATSGKFNGTVQATKFLDATGQDMMAAGKFKADYLELDAAHITGTLTVGNLPSNVATTGENGTNLSAFSNDAGYQTATGVTQIVKGTVTTDYINALGITAKYISSNAVLANNIQLNGLLCVPGYGYLGGSTLGKTPGAVLTDSTTSNYVIATNTGARMSHGGVHEIWVAGGCYSTSTMQVYSDQRLKTDIVYGLEQYDKFFDMFRPCTFRMAKDENGKRHFGLVAQDVLHAASACGLDENDLAVLGGYDGYYTLGYGELIALNIWKIQQLEARIAALEAAPASA